MSIVMVLWTHPPIHQHGGSVRHLSSSLLSASEYFAKLRQWPYQVLAATADL